jgi:type I restriction enzyme M protein
VAEDHGDPETLLEDLTNAAAEVTPLRESLKAILFEALVR